jgi:hypothetical protein
MITADTVMVNPKYGIQHIEHNACHWILFSNHVSAIPLEKTDRRTECVVYDDAPQDDAYFEHLYGLLHDEAFIAAIMHELSVRDISGFKLSARAKDTAMKQRVFSASNTGEHDDLLDALESWAHPLATMDELASLAGVTNDRRSTVTFSFVLEDCGWTKLTARYNLPSGKKTIYCRKADFSFWNGKPVSAIRAGLRNGGAIAAIVPMEAAKQSPSKPSGTAGTE